MHFKIALVKPAFLFKDHSFKFLKAINLSKEQQKYANKLTPTLNVEKQLFRTEENLTAAFSTSYSLGY